jgi:cytidylate kinase
MKNFSIAIDGPAGSGKSTIAKMISKNLGIIYVDTGAMYRAIALYFVRENINLLDTSYIISNLHFVNVTLKYIDSKQYVFLNDEDVSDKIRTVEVSNAVSDVAKIPEVRTKLVSIQRNLANNNSIVMDGRDIGTNVLPNATLKIFLIADIDERVKRRSIDFLNSGETIDIKQIKADMLKRDYQDSHREASPLKKANDAIEIDTTALTIEEVCKKILSHLNIID